MATRKSPPKKKDAGPSLGCLFWLAFLILMLVLFLVNKDSILKALRDTGIADRFQPKPVAERPAADPRTPPAEQPSAAPEPATPGTTVPAPGAPSTPSPAAPAPSAPATPAPSPGASPTAAPSAAPSQQTPDVPKEAPVAAPAPKAADPGKKAPPAAVPKTSSKPRAVYFIRIDSDGVIARTKATRELPASDTPLVDALQALLAGPSEAEAKKGLVTLINPQARLLSATVRGTTAYLNFSDEFQINSYGIEGYAGQLRQVIWTATEFPNVKDVQILLEGRRVDYLGAEGIWIGSPLGRSAL